MNQQENGGPAFPIVSDSGMKMESAEGMSLRDYFAEHAPISPAVSNGIAKHLVGRARPQYKAYMEDDHEAMMQFELDSLRFSQELDAAIRYMHADAMLAERNNQQGE